MTRSDCIEFVGVDEVIVKRHGDGFFRVIADGQEMSRALTVEQAVTWVANLLLDREGAHVELTRYPAAFGQTETS